MNGNTKQANSQQIFNTASPVKTRWIRSLPVLCGLGVAAIVLTYDYHRCWFGRAIGADVKSVAAQVQTKPSQSRAIAGSIALFRLGVKSREAIRYKKPPATNSVASSRSTTPRPTLRSYVNAANLILSAITPHPPTSRRSTP